MPADAPEKLKSQLREIAKARLRGQPAAQRTLLSGTACDTLLGTPVFRAASSVMLYMPMREELDITPLMNAAFNTGKHVCLPRMDWAARTLTPVVVPARDFVREVRRFGIEEPAAEHRVLPLAALDLVLVPGLAFDASGRRLGRGAGFYDRFLEQWRAQRPPHGIAAGIGFDFQVFTDIPAEQHDQPLEALVTERRFILCRTGGTFADSR